MKKAMERRRMLLIVVAEEGAQGSIARGSEAIFSQVRLQETLGKRGVDMGAL